MNDLEYHYEESYKPQHLFPRKKRIQAKKTLLCGAAMCGKTYLILDHLSHFEKKEFLYLDLQDERIDLFSFEEDLHAFLKKYAIKLLVVENYDFSFDLPDVEELIISTRLTCKELEGFEKITLTPLDFEEYIAFDKRHFNVEQLFNLFTHTGTLPYFIALGIHYPNTLEVQKILRSFCEKQNHFRLLKTLALHQGLKVSLHKFYTLLKPHMKISKDKLYELVKSFEQKQLIFLVQKYKSEKSNKKLFLFDFAMKNALTCKKDFLKTFENMVFLELRKREQGIFYTDFIDLYLPNKNLALFCIPFLTEEFIKIKLSKLIQHLLTHKIRTIEVITVGNEGFFMLEKISCRILPFWDWALEN